MSFYYESIDLDLKKNFTTLHYDQLEDDKAQESIYMLREGQQTVEGESQQLVVERQILVDDVRNLCTYFYQKFCNDQTNADHLEKLKQFPFEKVKNRLCHIIARYQEQSSLLDCLLEQLVSPLANIIKLYCHKAVSHHIKEQIKSPLEMVPEFHIITDSIYNISKVRGVRHISRYFPHEVRDLEPVVYVLQRGSQDRNTNWETKYVLLLWLSVIVLVPFDLSTIDSNLFSGIQQEITHESLCGSILLCLVNLGVYYLRSSTRLRNAGALFLSKLFSRPDVLHGSTLLQAFIEWSVNTIQQQENEPQNAFFVTGILETLVEMMKSGQRDELRPFLVKLIPLIGSGHRKNNSLINLFLTKLSQRVGLVYLRPRVVSWAYEKGNQNLGGGQLNNKLDFSKLITNTQLNLKTNITNKQQLEAEIVDYFGDVDQDALEAVVDNLLIGLTNKDTIVRWSAAKGIGRICARLELDQADDIFTALLETCFTPVQGDTAWHGGCLALGELCRRGLILQSRLHQVVPIVCKALVFEQNQGGYSIGVNVRDSACYVAWSAARAYDPGVLLPFLPDLSQTLCVVMLFDREVNVRRAASSTFQELVGRCPNVIPHGIQILSESDYFSLALRHNAYLKVAPFVAAFKEYYAPLVDHLGFIKVQSQDREVRLLSSKSLSRLAQLDPDYFVQNHVIEGLLEMSGFPSVNSKHGALYALGDLFVALSGKTDSSWEEKDLKDSIFLRTLTQNERQLAKAGEHISKFKGIFNSLLKVNNLHKVSQTIIDKVIKVPNDIIPHLKGVAGTLLRSAVCRLVECISIAKIPISIQQHQIYLDLIEDCLKNPLEEGQQSAVRALEVLSLNYHQQYETEGVAFLKKILKDLESQNKLLIRTGLTQAVGAFSANIVNLLAYDTINVLCKLGLSVKRTNEHTTTSLDPDSRKFAVKSLGLVVSRLMENDISISDIQINQIIYSLLQSIQDYTMNKRGDVGLYIRENAILSILKVLTSYVKTQSKAIDGQLTQRIVGELLQQLVEKIDRVRLVAGSVLQELFKSVLPKLPKFDYQDQIAQVFSTQNLQKALTQDQNRVDLTFQSEVIAAEVKQLSLILAQMTSSEIVYHWNLPHCCYRLIVPLLRFSNITYPLFKGLCVSVGGISESIQKFSQEALGDFITYQGDEYLPLILETSIQLMKSHQKDERVLNPLYKTLAFLLEREDVHQHPKIKYYVPELFQLIWAETKASEAIKKINESVPVVIELLSIYPESIGKPCLQCIQDYLSCDLPIVRKSTADKFYLFLMSYENEDLITMENNLQLQDYLLEVDWLSNSFDMALVKSQLENYFKDQQ